MRALRFAAAAALLGLASGCAASLGGVAANAWSEVRSPHFRLWTDARPEVGRGLVTELERIHAILAMKAITKAEDPMGPPLLIVANNSDTYGAFTRDRQQYESRRGEFVKRIGEVRTSMLGNYVVAEAAAEENRDRTQYVLRYLYTGFLASSHAWHLPRWYSAGVATLVTNIELGDDGSFTWGCVPPERGPEWAAFRWGPLRRVMDTDDGLEGPGRDDPNLNVDVQGWFLLRFFGDDGQRRARLARYFELWQEGEPYDEIIPAAFGVSPEQLEAEAAVFARSALRCIKQRPAFPPAEIVVRPLASHEVDQQLGEIELELRGANEEALKLLQRAANQRPSHLPTLASLTRFHVVKASLDDDASTLQRAERYLEQLRRVAPGAAETWALEGELHRIRAQRLQATGDTRAAPELLAARRAYRTAIRGDELRAEAYYGLGLTYLLADNGSKEGPVVLEAAMALRPSIVDIPIALARLHTQRGERDRALAVLRRVRRFSSDDDRARVRRAIEASQRASIPRRAKS